MAQYKIEFFDEGEASVSSLDAECWDDAEAIDLASTLSRGCKYTKLWRGNLFIGRAPPFDASSTQLTRGRTRNFVHVDRLDAT